MSTAANERDANQALRAHVLSKATAARAKYGPQIDVDRLRQLLDDRVLHG